MEKTTEKKIPWRVRKSELALARREQDNWEFLQKTPAEQRVQIALDVLEQLRVGKICASFGVFVDQLAIKAGGDIQLCDALEDTNSCAVCAVGAVFTAAVRRADGMSMKKFHSNYGFDAFATYLERFFDTPQIAMMEAAFEHGDGSVRYAERVEGLTFDLFERAIAFGTYSDSAVTRMTRIMENVAAHGGEFRP
jgi:hypothetical protein